MYMLWFKFIPGLHFISQGERKVIFTACHLGKLKLAFTSPNVILTILRDPGADSGGEGKSKQAGKYGTKEN